MEDISFHDSSLQDKSDRGPASKAFLMVLIIVLIAGAVIFGASRFKLIGGKSKVAPTQAPAPTSVPTEAPTETPAPTGGISPTSKPTTQPTKAAVDSIDKKTGLDRSKLQVEIQNGSGVVGAAQKVSDTLKDLGYKVVAIGNADNFDYEQVSILVKSGKDAYLPLLKRDLAVNYGIGSTSATLSDSASSDALVIIGK